MLKDESLAKVIGLKNEKIKQLVGTIIDKFKQRFERGSRPQLGDKSVEELVKIISHNTVKSRGARKNWNMILLRKSLPRDEILKLEERLKIALPTDYNSSSLVAMVMTLLGMAY